MFIPFLSCDYGSFGEYLIDTSSLFHTVAERFTAVSMVGIRTLSTERFIPTPFTSRRTFSSIFSVVASAHAYFISGITRLVLYEGRETDDETHHSCCEHAREQPCWRQLDGSFFTVVVLKT